jgi:CDP-paratose 2-epimerase
VSATTLITGGAGFVGTNLADRLLRAGERVRILDDLSRPGVTSNLEWLESMHPTTLEVEVGDICDRAAVARATRRVRSLFHFAAQVAVTTSLEEPMRDAAVNLQGTLNLLEEARAQPTAPTFLFTSTNKVYGALEDIAITESERRHEPALLPMRRHGVNEERPLAFCTPYGCSKGAADQYVLDYAASYAVPATVFRMSCIYGPHQAGTEDQGWVAHFLISAMRRQPITIYGDGKQVRDILFVEDLVDALLVARERIRELAGRPFNIGGGPRNSVSLLEVIATIGGLIGEQPEVQRDAWRTGDQRWYVSDTSRFSRLTGWRPGVSPKRGLEVLHDWLQEAQGRSGSEVAEAVG